MERRAKTFLNWTVKLLYFVACAYLVGRAFCFCTTILGNKTIVVTCLYVSMKWIISDRHLICNQCRVSKCGLMQCFFLFPIFPPWHVISFVCFLHFTAHWLLYERSYHMVGLRLVYCSTWSRGCGPSACVSAWTHRITNGLLWVW